MSAPMSSRKPCSRKGLVATAAISLSISVSGCASAPRSPAPAHAAACPPLVTYTPAQQKAIQAARQALSPDNPLNGLVVDYERMRDADRACLGAKP